MKKIFAILSILVICGCVSTREIQSGINGQWMGRDFDEFVLERGIPKKKFKLNSGDITYNWKSPKIPSTSDKKTVYLYCSLQIVTDKKNIIKEITILEDTAGTWLSDSRCQQLFK